MDLIPAFLYAAFPISSFLFLFFPIISFDTKSTLYRFTEIPSPSILFNTLQIYCLYYVLPLLLLRSLTFLLVFLALAAPYAELDWLL